MSSPQPPDGGQQGQQPQGTGEQPADAEGTRIGNRLDPQQQAPAAEGTPHADSTQVVRPAQVQGQIQPDQQTEQVQQGQVQGEQPSGEATQMVRADQAAAAQAQQAQQQGQQGGSEATQMVPPPSQQPQPMYEQPGHGDGTTQVVPPSMQPPQPMYSQPGTQSQPGGFPQQPGTPGGGFPAPQAQQGFGAPPPQSSPYGQPGFGQFGVGDDDANRPTAMAAAWTAIAGGGVALLLSLIGIGGASGFAMVLVILGMLALAGTITGGAFIMQRKPLGKTLAGGAGAAAAVLGLITMIVSFQLTTVFVVLLSGAAAVLAFLPTTGEWLNTGAAAPVPATGGFGQPPQAGPYGQPPQGQPPQGPGQPQFGQQPPQAQPPQPGPYGQPPYGQPPQGQPPQGQPPQGQPPQGPGQPQFGQQPPQPYGQPQPGPYGHPYGQPPQQGGYPPQSGQQPPQW